jgi:lauroyl/myristoyl acyltransferase
VAEETGTEVDIEELVELARSRAFTASLVRGIEEPADFRGLTFPEIVVQARIRAAHVPPENVVRQRCLARARLVLGSDAPDEQIEELTRRTHAGIVVGNALAYRPEECSRAPIEGEGLELLRDPDRAAIISFAHTTTSAVGFYALPRALGRLVFVPNERTPGQAPPIRMRQYWCEEFGVRYLMGDETCMDVMQALLDRREICGLAADQPGETEATFFGFPVATKAGAAVLARRTGNPVVIVTSWFDDERFGLRVSPPLYADEFESPDAHHQAILTTIETQLGGDVSRFIGDLELTLSRRDEPQTSRSEATRDELPSAT